MTVDANGTWYWLRPDRAQVSGSLSELKALLSGRSLPRSTLVWTEPWPEWLPATDVSVLADALPPSAQRNGREPAPSTNAPSTNAPSTNAPSTNAPAEAPPRRAVPAKAVTAKAESVPAKVEVPRPGKAEPREAQPDKAEPAKSSAAKPQPTPSAPSKQPALQKPQPIVAVVRETPPKLVRKPAPSVDIKFEAAAPAAAAPAAAKPAAAESPVLDAAPVQPSAAAPVQPSVEASPVEPAAPPAHSTPPTEAATAAPPTAKPDADAPPDSAEYEPVSVRADGIEFDPLSVRGDAKALESAAPAEAVRSEAAALDAAPPPDAPTAETAPPAEPASEVVVAPAVQELRIPLEPMAAVEANLHGPASTPGFYPIQHLRIDTTSEAPVELAAAAEERAPLVQQKHVVRRAKTALWAVSAVCGVLALALGLTVRALRARPLTVAVQTSLPAPLPAPAKPFECSLLAPAAKLAASVDRAVDPSLMALDENRVAIGFAAASAQAQGIVVDLNSLDVTRAFDESADARVSQVNALYEQPPRFQVEREGLDFASPRVLATEPPSELGVAREAVMLRSGSTKKALWALPAGHGAEPRSVRLPDGSQRVVLRRGGASGEIVIGRIAADGSALGELEVIESGVRLLGSPDIAANKNGAAVVFAGRDQKSEPFALYVATLPSGTLGTRSVRLPIDAKEGNGAIAPALSALGEDAWLLQWTQGEVGHYRVFVQPFDAAFSPLASPVAVSPMGANAGQGVVRSFGEKALSLFVLPVPGHDELWGAVLKCR